MVFWRPKGCVLWFDFAELRGNTVYDLSGHGNHGKIYGAQWRRGPLIGSLYFDGVDDYVEVPLSDSLRVKVITVEALVKPLQEKAWNMLVINNPSPPYDYFMWFSESSFTTVQVGAVCETEYRASRFNAPWKVGEWHYIVWIYDGWRHIVYLNGNEIFRYEYDFYDPIRSAATGPLQIAMYQGHYFPSIYAFIRIYNRPLTENEIIEHYNYIMKNFPRIVKAKVV